MRQSGAIIHTRGKNMPIMPTKADTTTPAATKEFATRVQKVQRLQRWLPALLVAPLRAKLAQLKSASRRAADDHGTEYARWRHAGICARGGDQLVNGCA